MGVLVKIQGTYPASTQLGTLPPPRMPFFKPFGLLSVPSQTLVFEIHLVALTFALPLLFCIQTSYLTLGDLNLFTFLFLISYVGTTSARHQSFDRHKPKVKYRAIYKITLLQHLDYIGTVFLLDLVLIHLQDLTIRFAREVHV